MILQRSAKLDGNRRLSVRGRNRYASKRSTCDKERGEHAGQKARAHGRSFA